MCGIIALQNLDGRPVDPALLQQLRDIMTHRGPDDAGLHIDGAVGLGHRRLSIVDLSSAGHQPMCNEDGTVWLVFNGEIYNYVELAADLERRGHRFRSHTDSEVIIHLYEEFGSECLKHLNGMFAFVIWDAKRRTLFGARDRIGIKPFFYHMRDGAQFLCASEAKAILEHPSIPRALDPEGFAGWFFAGKPEGGRTLFRGVQELQPGYALRLVDGRLTTWKYWDVTYRYNSTRTTEQTVAELADLLDDAVRIHCRSDAPLGCHLSGGIDSSTVVSLTARHRPPFKTFSIRFDGEQVYDETSYARVVAEHVGAEWLVATPTHEDFKRLVGSLIWHMDAPLMPSSAFAYHTVSALASRHVKVSMTGHGGDEVFAGYPAQFMTAFGSTAMFQEVHRAPQRVTPFNRLRLGLRRGGVTGLAARLFGRFRPPAPLTSDPIESLWIRLHCGPTAADDAFLHPDFVRSLGGYDPTPDFLAPLREAGTTETLDRCLYHDLRHYLPILLAAEDRVSMAVSLESRVPLLDYRIVEFLATVPPAQKVTGMLPKALLRLAAKRWVPQVVLDRRDKGPFAVPTHRWLTQDLAPFVRDILRSRRTLERGVFDPRVIRNGLLEQISPWTAVMIELWYRIVFDQDTDWLDRIGAAQYHASPAAIAQASTRPAA
jgi:asparagine synthase (glutamine-hydrolysing)